MRPRYAALFLSGELPATARTEPEVIACARAELGQALFLAGVAALGMWNWPLLLHGYLLPLTVAFVLNGHRFLTEHTYVPATDRRLSNVLARTRDIGAGPLDRLLFAPHNLGLHAAHHRYPGASFRKLPVLAAAMSKEISVPRISNCKRTSTERRRMRHATPKTALSLIAALLMGNAGCSADAPGGDRPRRAHQPDTLDSADTDTRDTDTHDTRDTDEATEPASRAGGYEPVAVEQAVVSGSVRSSAVAWNGERWVAVYTGVTGWHNVYAVALTGSSAGAPVRVDDGDYDAFEPEIAAASDGTMLAVFEDDRVGAGTCCREIYARFLDVGGIPVGASFDLTNQPAIEEYTPAVANDSGTWFVAWSDDREYGLGVDRRLLYGRTVGNDGSLGAEIRIGGDSLWQVYASVAGSGGEGKFLTVWGDYDPRDGSLDGGYRARVIGTSGAALTDVIDIARIGNNVYDRPAVAWNPWAGAWLVVWMGQTQIHGTWVWPDGSTADVGVLAAPADGAGSARLTYAPTTHSFLLAYHAWWTYDGYVQELDADATPVGDRRSVNATTPPLGTFWVPIAASERTSEVLVVPSLDYSRITASLYRSP